MDAVDESGLTIYCPWHMGPDGFSCPNRRGSPHNEGRVKCTKCATIVLLPRKPRPFEILA